MKTIITVQHPQSIHHTNGIVGSWTDWALSAYGKQQVETLNQSELFGLSGGVSYLSVDNAGKRTIKKLSDMSYQADL